MFGIEEFDRVMEALSDAIDNLTKPFECLAEMFRELMDAVEELYCNGTPPKQYGISLVKRRGKKDKPYCSYRCIHKIQRHLPYQRRIY